MPCVSRFYGIAIYLYYRDHAPPHFHAIYGSEEAAIEIETGEILAGSLSHRARALVVEWTGIHRDELMANWNRATAGEPINQVPPLD